MLFEQAPIEVRRGDQPMDLVGILEDITNSFLPDLKFLMRVLPLHDFFFSK